MNCKIKVDCGKSIDLKDKKIYFGIVFCDENDKTIELYDEGEMSASISIVIVDEKSGALGAASTLGGLAGAGYIGLKAAAISLGVSSLASYGAGVGGICTMKFRLYDIRAIRILFVYDFVFLVIITSCGIAFPPFFNIPTYIFGSLLLICILTQVGLYLFPRGYVLFCEKGIEFISRKVTTQVLWKDVGELIYNDLSYIFFLKQNTMEFWYKEGDLMISIEKNYYPIKISKKKFTQLCEYKQ